MDETPEELERIRREADGIDPYKYRRRNRALAAVGVGAFMAALVWVVLEATDQARNPCQRVRDHFCGRDPKSAACAAYQGLFDESTGDENATMRSTIRAQCVTKIERLKADEGVEIP
jgi:hypothetical protein